MLKTTGKVVRDGVGVERAEVTLGIEGAGPGEGLGRLQGGADGIFEFTDLETRSFRGSFLVARARKGELTGEARIPIARDEVSITIELPAAQPGPKTDRRWLYGVTALVLI